jgi:homoserine acetyltransferase
MFGPDQPLDANKYYLILPDSTGLGGSSKPSDGLHDRFPHYGYNDMVEAQQQLVTQGLGINHLIAVLGTSMGGMHAWIWVHQFLDNAAALIRHNELDANDLVHRLEASADYDPAPDLNQVKAAVLSINFADDEINPPALGFIQREKEALPHGEFVLIPASNETVGHRTQGKASVYQKYVSAFMEKLNARQ